MSAGQRPLRRAGTLSVPAADALRWLRVGATGLAVVLVAILAVGMLLSDKSAPHSASSTLLARVASQDPLAAAAREESATNAAQNSPSGFQDGKAPRDRDISLLVLDDHAAFRRWFALLDEAEGEAEQEAHAAGAKAPSSEARDSAGVSGKIASAVGKAASVVGVGGKRGRSTPSEETVAKLSAIWNQLSLHLEIHADAEEKLLYPTLVRDGGKGAADETKDAIGDHNKIRDAIVASKDHPVGSAEWWTAVGKARSENTEHLGEEEDEALPDFRRHTTKAHRVQLGEKWVQFYKDHPRGKGLDLTKDNDPDEFVKKYEQQKKERKQNNSNSK